MKNRIVLYGLLWVMLFTFTGYSHTYIIEPGNIKFIFINTVKGIPIVFNDSLYNNPFGERYSIKNLKYYISHISLSNLTKPNEKENYQLIDEANESSKTFSIYCRTGTYTNLNFILGVDSLHNVSGAQTNALDPMNGMFWTWNSGYIMAKFEGASIASSQVNNRVEYHIGGFSGVNNVLKNISLPLNISHSPFTIQAGKTTTIFIEADIDKWWQHPNDITIATSPVCTTPGELAKKIADNYSKMFAIKNIVIH
ncbi:MAG: MbnP family protein [Ferruginibacter sp.]